MLKEITISPKTKEIQITALSLSMKNELLGFGITFPEFVGAMKIHHPDEYLTKEGRAKLKNWWLTRLKDEEVNGQVNVLINHLKGDI